MRDLPTPDTSWIRSLLTAVALSTIVLLLLFVSPLDAARFGLPDGPTDPPGYFVLTGPDVPTDLNNGSWGDNRHFLDFFIEVTGSTLRVDVFDPGLVTNNGLDLFFGGTVGTVTYTLYDPAGMEIASMTYGPDDAASDMRLVNLYDGPSAPGLYRLNANMDDDPGNADEDINAYGVSVPGYDFYSYYFTGGETNLAGGSISEPMIVYPLILESTPSTFDGAPITGIDVISHDMDSLGNNPPPDLRIETPTGRDANLEPSTDSQIYTTNLRGIDVSDFEGTDYGLYILETTNVDGAMEDVNDLNILTYQIADYESAIDPADFPVLRGDPANPRRLYYPRDDGSAPLKETMVHTAAIVAGPDPPVVGTPSDVEVTLEIRNPSGYDLTGIDVVTSMTRDAQFTDPVVVGSAGGLSASAVGRDITVTGGVAAGETGSVTYATMFTPATEDRFYITGDGTDLQGGTLPTQGTYQTPFAQPPDAERFGPIHMLRIESFVVSCVIDAAIDGDLTPCEGDSTILDASGSPVVDCPGVPEYRWLRDGLEIHPYPGPANIVESPVAPTTYRVEVRCSTLHSCEDWDEVLVTLDPAVVADAGPRYRTCEGEGVTIGGAPTASGGTGALSCAWDPAGDLDDSRSCNPLCTPSGPATPLVYTVTVSDEAGCTDMDVVQVDVDPAVMVDAGPDRRTCERVGVAIGGSPTAWAGTGALTCRWDPVTDLDDPNSCNPVCTPTGPASPLLYTVTVTDDAGCAGSSQMQVEVLADAPPTPMGPSLRLAREGDDVRFTWTRNGSFIYNLRRHDDAAFDRATSELMTSGDVDTYLSPGEIVSSFPLTFYQVLAVNCSGTEE